MGATGSRGLTLARGGRKRLLGDHDLRIVLQFVEATVGDHVSRIDAGHSGQASIGDASLDVADLRRVILNDINKRRLPVVLNGGGRNQSNALQGVHQQPGVYKLIGKKRVVLVIEERTHLDSAGGGIDLVIEGEELSAGDFSLLSSIESIEAQLFSVPGLGLHLSQTVFRD